MSKRIHYPINKDAIQKSIDLYNVYNENMFLECNHDIWCDFYDSLENICHFGYFKVAAASLFQVMKFANTLDVEHVYYTILASGLNTKLEDDLEDDYD